MPLVTPNQNKQQPNGCLEHFSKHHSRPKAAMLVTYRLRLAAFFCERAKVWVFQPSLIGPSWIWYNQVRRVRPDMQPSPVFNARRSSWQKGELHRMALEVTRGLSGVLLVTPSVLVSITIMGISEGNTKCRGSMVWDLENQHQGLSVQIVALKGVQPMNRWTMDPMGRALLMDFTRVVS